MKKRIVAKKIWLADLHNGNFIRKEGFEPNYVEVDGEKYSRINVIATAVSKFVSEDGNYGTLILDDGTETIRIKCFGPDVRKITDVKVGDIVRSIGRLREYQGEIYISPEAIRVLEDPNWIIVHRLELKEPKYAPNPSETKPELPEEIVEEVVKEDLSAYDKILNIIKELDSGIGAEMDKVISKSGMEKDEAKNVIVGLLQKGEIYEPKRGYLKVLE